MFPTMAQNSPPPMKLYIMSDTMTAVKALCTGQKEKKVGVSGAREPVVMESLSITRRCKVEL